MRFKERTIIVKIGDEGNTNVSVYILHSIQKNPSTVGVWALILLASRLSTFFCEKSASYDA